MSNTIRFRFAKGTEVRFLSHLDLLRALERALRRADLPIAYSKGFSPKPKMSFSFALPVGVLSTAEYGDFEFAEFISAQDFKTVFNRHLPAGLRVLEAQNLPGQTPALMSVIDTAVYELVIPGRSLQELEERLLWLESADTFMAERQTKKGKRALNIRPFLYGVPHLSAIPGGVKLELWSALGNRGNLRINEMGLLLDFIYQDALITRIGQLIKTGKTYTRPMGS